MLHPDLPQNANLRDPLSCLDEGIGLAAAIDLDVAHSEVVRVNTPRPATLLGGGAVERIKEQLSETKADLIIINTDLTPIQQRNLELAWEIKVIDRTGLILEIFGERARTREGQLQVELAALTFQRSRLVRSWTHLERQRGGLGFVGGPGETQIEIDRRLIDERIVRLKKDLASVQRTRALHREARARVPYPIVALVGYTNAGKSTLFNKLAGSNVMAQDLLFATLDPTMRLIKLPSGAEVIMSDTVGFISDLPTHLVAAFRATLEEVCSADLIVHVQDVSHPDHEAQVTDVEHVLKTLDLDPEQSDHILQAYNKADLLDDELAQEYQGRCDRDPERILISAETGQGLDKLSQAVEDMLTRHHHTYSLSIDLTDGAALAWLYEHGKILSRQDDDLQAHLNLRIAPQDFARFSKRFVALQE